MEYSLQIKTKRGYNIHAQEENVVNIVFFKLTYGLIIIGWLHRPREWLKSAKSPARLNFLSHLESCKDQAGTHFRLIDIV